MTKYLFTLLAILIIACSPHLSFAPAQADADRAAQKWSGTTLADLQKGYVLYKQTCAGCHALKPVNSETEQGWNYWVPIMSKKANIDDASQQLILHYLVTMCSVKS